MNQEVTAQAIVDAAQLLYRQNPRPYLQADSPAVKFLFEFAKVTDFQIRALWSILGRYKTLLRDLGVDYDSLVPPPPLPLSVEPVQKKIVQMKLVGHWVSVLFPYNVKLIELARRLPNRKWDKDGEISGIPKTWVFPATAPDIEESVLLFGRADVEVVWGDDLRMIVHNGRVSYEESRSTGAQVDVPTKIEPYPFQKAGIKWISDHGGRALISDEPGLGKTLQALGWLVTTKELPALVICPANLRVNWLRETQKFTHFKCLILSSKSSLAAFKRQGLDVSLAPVPGHDIVIANYDLLSKSSLNGTSFDEVKAFGFKTLICDEAHYLKEPDSQRSASVRQLSIEIKNVILLTGTPILNRTKEVWHLTQLLNRNLFPKFHDFGMRYCGAFKTRWGWQYDGASNLDELDKTLRSTIMIRRTKDQVLKELPAKTRVLVPFVLDGQEEKSYRKESEAIIARLKALKDERQELETLRDQLGDEKFKELLSKDAEKKSKSSRLQGVILEEMAKMRQACVHAKFDQCVNFVLNLHAQEKKILIFAVHHETIDRLMLELKKAGIKSDRIDGRVDSAKRDAIKESFQTGDLEVLVCGIRAAGEGLTLTASKTVVFMELDFTPGRLVQAEDRTHRVGQAASVTIYYLVLLGSIEEKIAALVDSKQQVVNSALGEGGRMLSETGILDAMLGEVTSGQG